MKTNHSIQILRGLAAGLVVIHHALAIKPWLFHPVGPTLFGTIGVDTFFVISGFIMYTAARDEPPLEFLRRRIIRIVPLYGFFTFLVLLIFLVRRSDEVGGFTPAQLVNSLFFIPHDHPTRPGNVWPLLIPGWTLNYEIFFYAVFAVGLVVRRIVTIVVTMILGLSTVGVMIRPENPVLYVWTNPPLLEFLAGFVIAIIYRQRSFAPLWGLAPVAILALLVSGFWTQDEATAGILDGLIAIALVVGTLGIGANWDLSDQKAWLTLGDASYSIYLVHSITIAICFKIFSHIPLYGWVQFVGLFVMKLIVAMAAGFLSYRYIELPMTRKLREWTVHLSFRFEKDYPAAFHSARRPKRSGSPNEG